MHLRHHQLKVSALSAVAIAAALAGPATAAAGVTEPVSVSTSGLQANDRSGSFNGRPAISADGNLVAFDSAATNLAAGATSGQANVYLRNRASGATELVSVTSNGTEPNGSSDEPTVSADGRYVAFRTSATNLVPGVSAGGVVVFDRVTHTTKLASVSGKSRPAAGASANPSISDDGRYVAFQADAPDLASGSKATGNPPFIYVRDLVAQRTELVSVSSSGKPAGDFSSNPAISGDGRYVAFESDGAGLVPGDTNGTFDVFVHDLQTGSTVRVSVDSDGAQARGGSGSPSISSDGRYVAFDSGAGNLVPGDTNQAQDVFVHDMLTRQTTRVSVDSAGNQANDSSDNFTVGGGQGSLGPQISGDGRHVTFESTATNLVAGDTNACTLVNVYDFPATGQCPDVFAHDLQTGATTRASLDSSGGQANGASSDPAIDADGTAVAFLSAATNLVPEDTNTCGAFQTAGQCPDIFVHTA
jgi:Tol biopolymer transport system component